MALVTAYRTHGHLAARLDPLGSEPKGDPALQPESVNLTPELMSQVPAEILRIGVEGETLLEALPRMRAAAPEDGPLGAGDLIVQRATDELREGAHVKARLVAKTS